MNLLSTVHQFLFALLTTVKIIVGEQDRVVVVEDSSEVVGHTCVQVKTPNACMEDTAVSGLDRMDDEMERCFLL